MDIHKLQNQIFAKININFFFLKINYIFHLHLDQENDLYLYYKASLRFLENL